MASNTFHNVHISGISFIVPDNFKHSVDDFPQFFDNNPKKMARAKKIMGYGDTYVSIEGLTVVDMAEVAANDLFDNLKISRDSIDALVFVSQSPDYPVPASACVLHDRLGLSESCATYDINQGCTGWVYGLWNASSLIESRACKRVLLISGDLALDMDSLTGGNSRVSNKMSSLIFSSGACATILEYSKVDNPMYFSIGSRGSGYEAIIAITGGARLMYDEDVLHTQIKDKQGESWSLMNGFMDGLRVFDFSMEVPPKNVKELLEYSGYSINDVDFFAFHQANKQIVENIAGIIGLPDGKYSSETFTKYGNMSGVSSASNLMDVCGEKFNHSKMKVAVVSFGIGLSWASVLMDLGNIYCSGIKFHTFENIKSRKEIIQYWIDKISNYSGS